MKHVPQLTADEAAALVKDGDTIFGGVTGNPAHLLHALAKTATKNLTYIGNNVGEPNLGGGKLLLNGQIRKMIGSFFTSNPDAVKAAQSGAVEYELLPQGTLAEAIRAGGAGIGGFYTPTSLGTLIAAGKPTMTIDGKDYVFEKGIRANVAFIRAWKADTAGNLTYRMTEQNFNRAMATAADLVVAEVEEIVPEGELDPNVIHTPGCFVDFLVQARITYDDLGTSASVKASAKKVSPDRLSMAHRAFQEIQKGDVVNLGIGIPTLVADLIKPEDGITLHTENGMLGVGPEPDGDGGALDFPVNADKVPVTALPGSSYFDSVAGGVMVVTGGQTDETENYIAPTMLTNVTADQAIMKEEIFGPVLPVLTYRTLNDAIDFVNADERPLALYAFGKNPVALDQIIGNTTAGGSVVNHVIMHYFSPFLSFGGVGNSGTGRGNGHFGFLNFSNQRPVFQP